jgi:hypothetical protein
VVRLGLPQPTGEALFSAQADASGRWGGRFTMPAASSSSSPWSPAHSGYRPIGGPHGKW